jgi:hypothetical protein
MTHQCCICHHLIQEGQRVNVMVQATYHILKSSVAYALDKTDLTADASSLHHANKEDCFDTSIS